MITSSVVSEYLQFQQASEICSVLLNMESMINIFQISGHRYFIVIVTCACDHWSKMGRTPQCLWVRSPRALLRFIDAITPPSLHQITCNPPPHPLAPPATSVLRLLISPSHHRHSVLLPSLPSLALIRLNLCNKTLRNVAPRSVHCIVGAQRTGHKRRSRSSITVPPYYDLVTSTTS